MNQFRIWIIYDQISCFPYFQTQIYVIKCHRQLLFKSSDFFIHLFFYHHTGCCHRTQIMDHLRPRKISRRISVHSKKCMSCHSSKPDDHSSMLKRSIFIIHSRPDSTYLFPHTIAQHFFNTVIADHFCIVVQKQQIFAGRMINSILIDLRIIESFSFPVQNLNFWILMHDPSIIFKRFLFLAVIFYNKNFYILIGIFFPDRSQAFDQIICVIFVRNNNRYLRCLFYRIFRPVHSRILRWNDFCFNSHSSVMRSYRFCTCIHNIGFIVCTACCRSFACSPVI